MGLRDESKEPIEVSVEGDDQTGTLIIKIVGDRSWVDLDEERMRHLPLDLIQAVCRVMMEYYIR